VSFILPRHLASHTLRSYTHFTTTTAAVAATLNVHIMFGHNPDQSIDSEDNRSQDCFFANNSIQKEKKTWWDCVKNNMESLGLFQKDAQLEKEN